ncbi:MPK4b [Symbiodinium sp. CCMP2592]|nr:MPK4b [Symbiodinium sp. CCMP2592]
MLKMPVWQIFLHLLPVQLWAFHLPPSVRPRRQLVPVRYSSMPHETELHISADGVPSEWADIAQSKHDPHLWEEDGVVLGKGAFGIVARGINKETGELVAIKRIAPTHKLAVATAKNEVEAATHLGEHPNVVQMKAYFLAPLEQGKGTREVILVYRLALGGDLQQWINQQHGNAFDVNYAQPKLTDEALRIMRQLVSGLQHIHDRGIQHRDLKPANILLSAGCTALIADFGIALVNRSSAREQGHAALGDFYFIDVDSLVTKELPYTRDDDVYSLGEVFVRILFGRYATGGDLRRFAEESSSELPPVVRILEQMLTSRDRRCPLSLVQEVLDELRFQPKPSEPRPIVFSIFLGIGAVMTARVLMEHLRKKKFRKQDMSVFSKRSNLKSSLQATFCVGQTQGRRPSLQDYYCHARIAWNVHKGARSWRLLGMFDGHGGKDCAKFAAQSLPHEVRRMLRETEAEAAGLEGLPLWRLASRGLQKALESLDRLYIKFRQKKNNMDLCGTTASVALLSPDGCHAVVSNIGDSRTGLVGEWEKLEHTGIGPESPSGLFMTHAHRVSDPVEMARIDAAGGFVEYGGSGHRVNGVLGVSRAIGYCGIKDYADLVPALSDNMIMERDGTKAGLVGLASDGLFRTCSEEEAETVFRRLAHADCYESLEQLVSEELDIAGGGEAANNKDNASILACLLPPL